jgi:uncharacterized protein YbaR (Trm112 family)
MSEADPSRPSAPVPNVAAPNTAASIDPRLLDLLVCPLTKGPLRYDRAGQRLISDAAKLAFPIRDGIPIMLIEEAKPLDDETP